MAIVQSLLSSLESVTQHSVPGCSQSPWPVRLSLTASASRFPSSLPPTLRVFFPFLFVFRTFRLVWRAR